MDKGHGYSNFLDAKGTSMKLTDAQIKMVQRNFLNTCLQGNWGKAKRGKRFPKKTMLLSHVNWIELGFKTSRAAELFLKSLPKFCRAYSGTFIDYYTVTVVVPSTESWDSTLKIRRPNKTTGSKNETGQARKHRFVEHFFAVMRGG